MTKQEFIDATDLWLRRQKRNQMILIAFTALLYGAWYLCSPAKGAPRDGLPALSIWPYLPFAFMFLFLIGNWLVPHLTFRRFGISCPLCGKPAGGHEAIIIATGNCGSCGGRILEDSDNPLPQ